MMQREKLSPGLHTWSHLPPPHTCVDHVDRCSITSHRRNLKWLKADIWLLNIIPLPDYSHLSGSGVASDHKRI